MNDAVLPIIHIIDDDDSLRSALSRLLVASGYRVAAYESAAKFLERTCAPEPGCILLDINMPGLSGVQLQEHLVKEHCEFPIIFLTGHGDIATSVRAIKAGAEDFLPKPVEKADLINAIQRALERYNHSHSEQRHLQDAQRRIKSLTAREKEVFDLLILGMLNKQVAYQLGNTERTVKAHRHSIMEKMQVKSLAELVLIASQLGMLNEKNA
ncbi:MAG: response regulator transcription factor [Burkholderiaceae bacterium]